MENVEIKCIIKILLLFVQFQVIEDDIGDIVTYCDSVIKVVVV
jgi:hypothetical protein